MADTEYEAAIRRKADAIEAANGDPAKVAELRHMIPADRRSLADVQTTADATVPLVEAEKPAKPVVEASAPKRTGRPRLAATRGMDTPKAATKGQ